MVKKNSISTSGIKIIKSDERAVVSQGGIKIQREKRPIKGELTKVGYVYLVVDCSGSMAGEKLKQAKNGALNFAKDALAKEYSTGVVTFDCHATHLCEPTRDIEILVKHIQKVDVGGSTNMTEAIRITTHNLKEKAGFRVIVIVTDGMPDNVESALEEAEQAKNKGIDIITIGTDDADEGFLQNLASRTDLSVMVAKNQLGQGITSTVKMLPQYGKKSR